MSRYKFQDIILTSSEKRSPVPGDEKNFIMLSQILPNSLTIPKWGVEELTEDERLVVKKGDIIFINRDPQNHQAAVSPVDGLCTGFAMVLRPKADVIDPDFLPYFITSDTFIGEAARISVGTKYKTANWGELKDLEFDLPEKDTQKRLTAVLRKLDQITDLYKALVNDLELAKQSYYWEKVLHAPTSRQMTLGELMTMHTDSIRYDSLENIRYITYEEMTRGTAGSHRPKTTGFYGYRLEAGQLAAHQQTFHKNGTVLVTAEFERAVISRQTRLFDVNQRIVSPAFLQYATSRSDFISQMDPIDLTTASWNYTFSKKKITIPDIQTQHEFLSFCEKADAGILQVQKCQKQAYEAFQAILCEYVTV